MKKDLKVILLSEIKHKSLKNKIQQNEKLNQDEKFLLLDFMGSKERLRKKQPLVEEFYQELCQELDKDIA